MPDYEIGSVHGKGYRASWDTEGALYGLEKDVRNAVDKALAEPMRRARLERLQREGVR